MSRVRIELKRRMARCVGRGDADNLQRGNMSEGEPIDADLLSSKSFRGGIVTIEMLNEARKKYLTDHPEVNIVFSADPNLDLKKPPRGGSHEMGIYVISRFVYPKRESG